MASDTSTKVRENRLRRMADRQGLTVEKCRRRDPRAIGFATYRVVASDGSVVAGDEHEYGLDLDGVEAFLTGDDE